jgi:iron complex outermembrane recepter protein
MPPPSSNPSALAVRWSTSGIVWAVIAALSVPGLSTAAQIDVPSLKRMSLEELGNLEVTSISKEPEELRRTPAAIYVITQDDIRRSGATTLPEILRMAPGLEVARIDTTHWSVGVRGFGDQFSKAVLLLMDGRSVYTPLFGGVLWAVQDTAIGDIDRIEIIRGPAGTIWGANAVNGVINIVSKSAAETQGLVVGAGTGNVNQLLFRARYGGTIGRLSYRVYGKGFRREAQSHADGNEFDTWRMGEGGGRVDWTSGRDTFSVQGDLYDGRAGQSVQVAQFQPPKELTFYDPISTAGGNVVATWHRQLGADPASGHVQLRTYYDRTIFDAPQLYEARNTFDVDFTHRLGAWGRHRFMWGAGARFSPSNVEPTVPTLDLAPHDQTNRILSGFVQDDITLKADRLSLTVGNKFEHHTYVGLELQPSARLLWTPGPRHSAWTAVTRSVRTPSRLERDFTLYATGTTGQPVFLKVEPNPDFDSETHVGYEAGYRTTVTPRLYVDVAAFHSRHDQLGSLPLGAQKLEPATAPTRVVFPLMFRNGIDGTSSGGEIAPTWRPTEWWQVRGYYAYLKVRTAFKPGEQTSMDRSVVQYNGSSPRHQSQVQSLLSLPHGIEADVTVRRVSSLPGRSVPAYTATDTRLGWTVSPSLRVSLIGRNVFDETHLEFAHDPPPNVEIRRSVTVTATWSR